jgi:tyrosyl-tRNA synthetase
MRGVMQELEWRGLVHQVTAPDLGALLDVEPLTAYIGFDPTADSLHVGSLLQLCNLKRLQQAGHRVIGLVGGGTGIIGDPSGRTEERQLLDKERLAANLAGIRAQVERLLDPGALVVDNGEWLGELRVTEFLRDVGKHFSVNEMIRKESVRVRLEGREQGISYTEFSYMLLQAYDFMHLFDTHGCRLQLGGSDQWGNITEGIELIRRLRNAQAYGITSPLLTLPGGGKMGKSVSGTVWLDAGKTSPYQFFQYWVRADDEHVGTYLRRLTFLERERIEELERATAEHPERRQAQRVLARELTTMVHGAEEAARAEHAAEVLYSEDIAHLDERTLLDVLADVPSAAVASAAGLAVVDALVETGLSPSKSAARKAIEQGGGYVNNRRVAGVDAVIDAGDLLHGRYVVLRRGKREQALLVTRPS